MQAEAELKGAEADVTRLTYLSNFKKVTAPFSGIITQRNIDVGDLIIQNSLLKGSNNNNNYYYYILL